MDTPFRDACVAYDAARREVANWTKVIGGHLYACYEAQCAKNCDTLSVEDAPSHIAEAYRQANAEYGISPGEYLAELCPHCLAAHEAVKARKKARQRFGSAKREIARLVRGLNQKDGA